MRAWSFAIVALLSCAHRGAAPLSNAAPAAQAPDPPGPRTELGELHLLADGTLVGIRGQPTLKPFAGGGSALDWSTVQVVAVRPSDGQETILASHGGTPLVAAHGQLLVVEDGELVTVWKTSKLDRARSIKGEWVGASPDGARVLVANRSDRTVQMVDLATGYAVRVKTLENDEHLANSIADAVATSRGVRLTGSLGWTIFWDIASGAPIATVMILGPPIAASSDGRIVATIESLITVGERPRARQKCDGELGYSLEFDRTRPLLYAGVDAGTYCLIDARSGEATTIGTIYPSTSQDDGGAAPWVSTMPAGLLMAVSPSYSVTIVDTNSGRSFFEESVAPLWRPTSALAETDDGSRVALFFIDSEGDGEVRLIDPRTRQTLWRRGLSFMVSFAPFGPHTFEMSANGSRVLAYGGLYEFVLLDGHDGHVVLSGRASP